MLLLVHHIHAQHVFQGLVRSFGLPVRLWVIRSTKVKLGSQGLLEAIPNHPVNIDPRLYITLLGTPCSVTISLMKMRHDLISVVVDTLTKSAHFILVHMAY